MSVASMPLTPGAVLHNKRSTILTDIWLSAEDYRPLYDRERALPKEMRPSAREVDYCRSSDPATPLIAHPMEGVTRCYSDL